MKAEEKAQNKDPKELFPGPEKEQEGEELGGPDQGKEDTQEPQPQEEGGELQEQENSDIKQKNQEPSESSFSSCHFLKDPLNALNEE